MLSSLNVSDLLALRGYITRYRNLFFDLRHQLFYAGHIAAASSVELNRKLSRDRQLHVFDHLSVAELDRKNLLGMRRGVLQLHRGERPQRNGTEQSHFDALLARLIDG